jgi:hypothetical protein
MSSGGNESARLLVVRFPDGSKEFRYPETLPEEGGVIWHDGERYRVVNITVDDDQASMIVEADSGIGDLLQSEEGGVRLEPLMR